MKTFSNVYFIDLHLMININKKLTLKGFEMSSILSIIAKTLILKIVYSFRCVAIFLLMQITN